MPSPLTATREPYPGAREAVTSRPPGYISARGAVHSAEGRGAPAPRPAPREALGRPRTPAAQASARRGSDGSARDRGRLQPLVGRTCSVNAGGGSMAGAPGWVRAHARLLGAAVPRSRGVGVRAEARRLAALVDVGDGRLAVYSRPGRELTASLKQLSGLVRAVHPAPSSTASWPPEAGGLSASTGSLRG